MRRRSPREPLAGEVDGTFSGRADHTIHRDDLDGIAPIELAAAAKLTVSRGFDAGQVETAADLGQVLGVVRQHIDQRGANPRAPAETKHDGRTLRTPAGASLTSVNGGALQANAGAAIVNPAGAVWDFTNDAWLRVVSGSATFTNQGILRKSGGTGTATLSPVLTNSGSVEVQSGTFLIDGGGDSAASFDVAAGAFLNLQTYTLLGGASVGDHDLVRARLHCFRQRPVSIQRSTGFSGNTQAMPATM